MAIKGDQDISGSPFNVGDYVNVRCQVLSITNGQGAGSSVNLVVETPGNVGEKGGVTLTVGPTQCRRSQGSVGS